MMIYVFFADGFEEIEAVTAVDLLRRAGLSVITVGVPEKTVTGAHGISVITDIAGTDAVFSPELEAIVLPGGMPGTNNLARSQTVTGFVQTAAERGLLIAAICAAPVIPGDMGLLEGKKAVCFPGYENRLRGATLTDAPVVRDGRFITAKSAGSAAAFALAIIAALISPEAAEKVKKAINGE